MNRAEYVAYLRSREWKDRRAKALKDAGWRCQDCVEARKYREWTMVARAVEVHHLTYERIGAELPEDLIALCAKHHCERHGLDYAQNRKGGAIEAWRRKLRQAWN